MSATVRAVKIATIKTANIFTASLSGCCVAFVSFYVVACLYLFCTWFQSSAVGVKTIIMLDQQGGKID